MILQNESLRVTLRTSAGHRCPHAMERLNSATTFTK